MQPIGPAPSIHHASGEFIDDDDFIVANNIVFVAVKNLMSFDRLVDVVNKRDVACVIKAIALKEVSFF